MTTPALSPGTSGEPRMTPITPQPAIYELRGGAYLLDEYAAVFIDSAGNFTAKTRGNPVSLVVLLRAIADDIADDIEGCAR